MKILVCVKQVPDTEAPIAVDGDGSWTPSTALTFRMNRFDEYAVEEALLIKERQPDTTIDALSVGTVRVQSTLRRALEMGVDHGVHIHLSQEGYVPPEVIAAQIRNYAQDKGYDLVLCGAMSEDFMHAQVGPLLAAMLGRPCLTAVIAAQISGDGKHLSVEQEIEAGQRQRFEMELPGVVSVQSGINHPRYPTLTNVLRARRQPLLSIDAQATSEPARVSFRPAPLSGHVMMLTGSLREQAREMLRVLREHAFL